MFCVFSKSHRLRAGFVRLPRYSPFLQLCPRPPCLVQMSLHLLDPMLWNAYSVGRKVVHTTGDGYVTRTRGLRHKTLSQLWIGLIVWVTSSPYSREENKSFSWFSRNTVSGGILDVLGDLAMIVQTSKQRNKKEEREKEGKKRKTRNSWKPNPNLGRWLSVPHSQRRPAGQTLRRYGLQVGWGWGLGAGVLKCLAGLARPLKLGNFGGPMLLAGLLHPTPVILLSY